MSNWVSSMDLTSLGKEKYIPRGTVLGSSVDLFFLKSFSGLEKGFGGSGSRCPHR